MVCYLIIGLGGDMYLDDIELENAPLITSAEVTEKKEVTKKQKAPRLTEMSSGGGCGCKVDPASLSEMLADVQQTSVPKDLLVGIEHSDDAAVYKINEEQAIVVTNDFFTSIVDDPYLFGKIAAANSLSDVYAMGGTPTMATAIAGFPVNELSMSDRQEIMRGGVEVCQEAGIPLAGGHTIDNPQPIFGLAVVGLVHPNQIKKNANAKVGDVLILTKPLGIGIMASAFKLNVISSTGYKEFVKNITLLNKPGAWLGKQLGVNAMTDITGFGLAGHLVEMAKDTNVRFDIDTTNVPIIEDALTHVVEGIVPSGAYRNMSSYGHELNFSEQWDSDHQLIFSDPQTNGGLLVSVEPNYAEHYVSELNKMGYDDVRIIGRVEPSDKNQALVSFL